MIFIFREGVRDGKIQRKRRRKRRRKRNGGRQVVMIDPNDLPKRAKWTIIITAGLLLLTCMLLVGITLRMAPIIDQMGELPTQKIWLSPLCEIYPT